MKMERIIAYIDGFNLYHGIRDCFYKKKEIFSGYKWLDLVRLSELFMTRSQKLEKVKYFTTDISSDKEKMARQKAYLTALVSHCGDKVEIIKGKYLLKKVTCYTQQFASTRPGFSPFMCYHGNQCNGMLKIPEEKMTDVNIATAMLVDAFANNFDTAFLVTGDSDLVPPVRAIQDNFTDKRVIVIFPPKRVSYELKRTVKQGDYREIKEKHLKDALLPQTITTTKGNFLHKPPSW